MTTSTTPTAGDLLRALVVPLRVATSAGELNLLSTIATFGTAVDITVADLSIESFFQLTVSPAAGSKPPR